MGVNLLRKYYINIFIARSEFLSKAKVNFLFTTHIPQLRRILLEDYAITWAKFSSRVKNYVHFFFKNFFYFKFRTQIFSVTIIEKTTQQKRIHFSHQVTFPTSFEYDEEEKENYG